MIIEAPKPLPKELDLPCYACEKQPATHLCCYKIDEMAVQVYLCDRCMKMDTRRLLEHTVGIQVT